MVAKPEKIDESFGGAFFGVEPVKLNTPESRGSMDYKGPALDYIKLKDGSPPPQLDTKLQRLIESSWKHAKPTDGAMRGNVFAGDHRVMHPSARPPVAGPPSGNARIMPPLPPRPGQQPQLPMVDQYKNVAPIGYDTIINLKKGGLNSLPVNTQKEKDLKNTQEKSLEHLMTTVPQDWSIMRELKVVSAYAFRGDKRSPDLINSASGFQPPSSRTDAGYIKDCIHPHFEAYLLKKFGIKITLEQLTKIILNTVPSPAERELFAYYAMWRGQVKSEEMHAGRMVAQQDLKGYISTTRAVSVAKGFAGANGVVYAVRVRAGFLIPSRGKHEWTHLFGEEEIACPSSITWDDVVGYRKLAAMKFDGPVYIRPSLFSADPSAFEKIHRGLSGKHTI